MFCTESDRANERKAADQLEKVWKCKIHSLGSTSQVDWFCYRGDKLLSLAELKTRKHAWRKFPTVFLSARKWAALNFLSLGLGIPAFFVVQWTDHLGYLALTDIDATKVKVGGHNNPRANNDREPLIEVPVLDFVMLPNG